MKSLAQEIQEGLSQDVQVEPSWPSAEAIAAKAEELKKLSDVELGASRLSRHVLEQWNASIPRSSSTPSSYDSATGDSAALAPFHDSAAFMLLAKYSALAGARLRERTHEIIQALSPRQLPDSSRPTSNSFSPIVVSRKHSRQARCHESQRPGFLRVAPARQRRLRRGLPHVQEGHRLRSRHQENGQGERWPGGLIQPATTFLQLACSRVPCTAPYTRSAPLSCPHGPFVPLRLLLLPCQCLRVVSSMHVTSDPLHPSHTGHSKEEQDAKGPHHRAGGTRRTSRDSSRLRTAAVWSSAIIQQWCYSHITVMWG